MKQLTFLLAALFIAVTGYSQTGFTEDFESDPGWTSEAEYFVSHQGTMEYLKVKKISAWKGYQIDLGGTYDISSNPVLTLEVLSEKPIKLFVYLVDADGKNTTRPQRVLNFGEFVNVCYDYTGDTRVDLTRISHLIFTVNGDALTFTGDLWFDNLKLGTDAEFTANLMANLGGLGKITHHSNAGSGSFLVTDIENSTGLTVTGAEDLIQNVNVSAIVPYDYGNSSIIEPPNSNGNVVVTYDLVSGGSGSRTVTVTAAGDTGYADNSVSFDIEIEGDQVPTIDQAENIEAGVGVYTEVMLSGISDGNSIVNQALTITAVSDDLSVISDVNIAYTEGHHAVLSFTALTSKMGVAITVTVQDNGAINNSSEMVFLVDAYADYNNAPTIDHPSAQSVLEGTGEQSTSLTGISDGDAGSQGLTITAVSSDDAVVLGGDIVITYVQGEATAEFVYTPIGVGTATITISVADDGDNGSNNGDAQTEVDFDIEVRVVAPTGHAVPMSEFDTTGMAASGRLEVLDWSIDGNLTSQSGTLGTFHGKDNVIKLDLTGKGCWGGLWYKSPEINADKNRYLSYDIYFEGSDFSAGAHTHAYFWDDGWDNNLDRNLNGAHSLRQNVTGDSWHTIAMDYSVPGGMDNKNGEEINAERIQKVLINYASNFAWPFPTDDGTVYITNIKIGSEVPEELLPEVTSECTINPVADRVHTEEPGLQEILLSGISAGDDGTVTPSVSVVSNNPSFITPVADDLENGTMLLTYEPTTGIDSAIITVTISATGSTNTEISFEIATVTAQTGSAANVTVDLSQEFQIIHGFGSMPPPEHLVDMFLDDLGSTVVRIGILNMLEPVNDNNNPFVLNRDGLNYDAVDWDYYRRLKASGAKTFILSLFTPPLWMKDNLSENYYIPQAPPWGATDNKLSRYYYDEFAETCVTYVKLFKEEAGIELDGFSLQNEPSFNEPYGSAIIDAAHWPELINLVNARFQAEGITTRIFALEEVQEHAVHNGIDAIQADPTANQNTEIIAMHGYKADGVTPEFADNAKWARLRTNCQEGDYPKEVWMTETSFYYTDWENAMSYATTMLAGLEYADVSLWAWMSFTKGYIINGNQPTNIYAVAKQFYKFIEPGAQRVRTTRPEDTDVMVSSYRNKDDTLAIVIVNKALEPRSLNVNIANGDVPAGFIVHQSIPYQICQQTNYVVFGEPVALPAMSITTLQAIPVENYTLTVNSGTGDGQYPEGYEVSIEADTPASGMTFDRWTGDTDAVADILSSATTLTMPASDVALTGTYKVITGIDPNIGQDLSIYPNPANESVFVVFQEAKYNTLVITNMLGEKVLVKNIDSSMDEMNLDVSGFVTGIYIVSLQNSEGSVRGRLVIE